MAGIRQPIRPFIIPVAVDLDRISEDEKGLLKRPETFFGDIVTTTPESIAEIARCGKKLVRQSLGDRRKSEVFKGLHTNLIAYSCFRKDKCDPPLCIFCLNSDPESTALLGPLRWVPKLPKYFAFHYLCAVGFNRSIPEEPSYLESRLGDLSLPGFRKAAARLNPNSSKARSHLKCTHCGMEGALLGCINNSCGHKYHVPCAIMAGCILNISSEQPYPFGLLCSNENKMVLKYQKAFIELLVEEIPVMKQVEMLSLLKAGKFDCEVCHAQLEIKGENDMFLRRMVFTSCCGLKATCRQCFEKFIISKMFAKYCISYNCTYTDNINNILGMQGILTLTDDDSEDTPKVHVCENAVPPAFKRFKQAPVGDNDDIIVLPSPPPPRLTFSYDVNVEIERKIKMENALPGGEHNPITLDEEEEFVARGSGAETEDEAQMDQSVDVNSEEQGYSVQLEPFGDVSEPDQSPMEATPSGFNLNVKQEIPDEHDSSGGEQKQVFEKRLTELEVQVAQLKGVESLAFDVGPPDVSPDLEKFHELCTAAVDIYNNIPKGECSLDQLIRLKQTLKMVQDLK